MHIADVGRAAAAAAAKVADDVAVVHDAGLDQRLLGVLRLRAGVARAEQERRAGERQRGEGGAAASQAQRGASGPARWNHIRWNTRSRSISRCLSPARACSDTSTTSTHAVIE